MSTFVFASVSTDTDKRQGRTFDDGGRGYVHDFAMIYCTLSLVMLGVGQCWRMDARSWHG